MVNMNKKEIAESLKAEYRSLTQIVGSLLIVESTNEKYTEDLAYYNRKLVEARQRIRKSKV